MTHELLNVNEVATVLRLRPPRVYELVRCGVLPAVRIGRQIRVDPAALHEWMRTGGSTFVGSARKLRALREQMAPVGPSLPSASDGDALDGGDEDRHRLDHRGATHQDLALRGPRS